MRFLILSDPHANWPALEAVLADAEGKFDQVVCCGDLVGYNPDPARVTDWIRQNTICVVRGNHDKVVAGIDSLEWFNEIAQIAARWTIGQLSDDQLAYLRELPIGPAKLEHFHVWHGSPRDEDEYVTGAREAAPAFEALEHPLAFFGHTHLQGIFVSKHRRLGVIAPVPRNEREIAIELEPDVLYLVNPGSVGQPRDGDPRAAYAIYDAEQKVVYLRRVDYPIQRTASAIVEAGLPEVLAQRLAYGF
ncbi:MAG TPA: metallophosphoesterase family protein [Bryobacteraceae bacterium]|nr:metallophosphoesterase family protein [Bryobacteraceae bacterium]